VKDLIAQGDKVAASWEVRGTQKGSLRTPTGDTLPATNKAIHISGASIYEIRNGMVMREDIYYDQIAFLTQLGLLTPQELTSMIRR
jgi:predicted ester cyclase